MKLALPVNGGKLCLHFGHCEMFHVFDIEDSSKKISGKTSYEAPPHEPGLLPAWLADKGVNCIIAGGMGSRARDLFAQKGISVIRSEPRPSIGGNRKEYLENRLVTGSNSCDH
jgi:predicted Fe-Mo cluster-binding NifX family protein